MRYNQSMGERSRTRFESIPSKFKILGKLFIVFLFVFLACYKFRCTSDPIALNLSESVSESVLDIFSGNVSETYPQVLKYINDFHLYPPSKEPYKLQNSLQFLAKPNKGLPMMDAIGNKQNGFFIECGANDGEFLTNTIGLEAVFNWTGLLVESSPSLFRKLQSKHRKAWISNVCLSGKIEKIDFLKSNKTDHNWRIGNGKINPGNNYKKPKKFGNEEFKREDYVSEGIVECFPLYSILLALNVTRVDFFSLDVEGHEYQILQGIPFDKIDIKVLLVEHWLAPEGKTAILNLMKKNGFALFFETASDFIFKKV